MKTPLARCKKRLLTLVAASTAMAFAVVPASAQTADPVESPLAYADVVDLAEAAPLVLVAQVRRASELKADRAVNVRPGWARLYIEADTRSLLSGNVPVGEKLAYLADVPLDSRGRVPKLKKRDVVLFASPVPGRPGELQLVAPDAQLLLADAEMTRLKAVLTALVDPQAPPRITGLRDMLHTPGNLAGEGETQIFLDTADGTAASLTVRSRPSQPRTWGLSTGELVDLDARPPAPGTLAWYRLACSLPAQVRPAAHLTSDPQLRQRAEADYAAVIADLGKCERRRVFD